MPTLDEARQALATAVSAGGLTCLPYPPDAPSPPIAFVDTIAVDFTGGAVAGVGYFCAPGLAVATIITVAQRQDRPGGIALLEGYVPNVLDQLAGIPGVRLVMTASGSATIAGQDLPSVFYTVQFVT